MKKLNTQSKTVNNAIITLGDTDDTGKGKKFKSRFIQPGIAGYPGQFGNVLITKSTFDKFINTMVGVPVIINHKDITIDNADDERVGVVSSVWYDDKDGWYWCDGVIWNETAINLIQDKKWSVSCSYDVKLADDKGGTENNIPYDIEFLDGVFTHLAIVDNPRYERANIVFNSKTVVKNGTLDKNGCLHSEADGKYITKGKIELSNAIDQLITGTYPSKKMLDFGNAPIVLQNLGVPNKPMYMPQHKYLCSTGRLEVKGQIHYISDNVMKQLPALLSEPLAVFSSRNKNDRYIALINAKDKNDKYIFVVVEYDYQQKRNNIIPSAYGKDDYINYIKNAYINNEILYQNKNFLVSGSRVQFPRCNQEVTNSIAHLQDKFNPKDKEMLSVENDKWITIHPNGEDSKGRPLLVKDGETPKEAIERTYGDKKLSDEAKKEAKTIKDNYINGDNISLSQYQKKAKEFEEKYGVPLHKVREDEDVKFTKKNNGSIYKGLTWGEIFEKRKNPNESQSWWIEKAYKNNDALFDDPEFSHYLLKSEEGHKTKIPSEFNEYISQTFEDKKHITKVKQKIHNAKEQEMALLEELKKLITKVENDKGEEMDDDKKEKVDNEKVDKRKLIDEVGGILKDKISEENWRTVIGKIEKLGYNESEAGTSDNKKVKNESEEDNKKAEELKKEVKEDVENKKKCDNSVENAKTDFFNKMNEVYNASTPIKEENVYVSRESKLQAAKDYFSK